MSLEARAGWARKSSTHAWSSNTGGPRPKLEAHTASTSGPVCNSMRHRGHISGLRHASHRGGHSWRDPVQPAGIRAPVS
jgi:hypothetical protein